MPPKVTAGLARSRVSGKRRSPAPPASRTPRVSFISVSNLPLKQFSSHCETHPKGRRMSSFFFEGKPAGVLSCLKRTGKTAILCGACPAAPVENPQGRRTRGEYHTEMKMGEGTGIYRPKV